MIDIKKDSVLLNISKNENYELPFLWLRDNCQCNECRIQETQEKQFLLHSVPVNITPSKIELIDENIFVNWEDGHKTHIPLSLIRNSMKPRYPKYESWEDNFLPKKFKWDDFLNNKIVAVEALKTFVTYGVIILNDAPQEPESLELLSQRFGPIHETLFERIHNVSVTGHVYNVAHTSKGLPPHNDFASYQAQPSVQALHMLVNECKGGESIIVDGWKVVEDLRNDCPEFFNILCEFSFHLREFDKKNKTFAEAPLIECNLDGSIKSFRFSNQLMQMIRPNKKGILDFYKAYHEISSRVFNPKYQSTFRLNSGEVLIVASLRVLHARESFVPNGKRHLQDAYFVFDNAANNIVHLLS